MTEKFTCAKCGGTFTKGWSDEEAVARFKMKNPNLDHNSNTAVICDNCDKQFQAWFASLSQAERDEMEREAIEDDARR